MAIARTNSAVGSNSIAGFSCSGSDRFLVVGVWGTGTLTGVTYGGVSMTLIDSLPDGVFGFERVYGLANPAAGANDISCSGTSLNLNLVAAAYSGVDQSGPPQVHRTDTTSSGSALTSTITTPADDCWLVVVEYGYFYGVPPTAGSGLTLVQTSSSYKHTLFDSNGSVGAAGAHSGTVNHSTGAGWAMQQVAMSLSPVGTGLVLPPISDADSLYAPTLIPGAVTLTLPAVAAAGVLYAPTIFPAVVTPYLFLPSPAADPVIDELGRPISPMGTLTDELDDRDNTPPSSMSRSFS